jgi:phosphatidylserine decarboxylase
VASRGHPIVSGALLAAAAGVALALRDPDRATMLTEDALAPADGRVVRLQTVKDDYFGVEMRELSIFLALWHVHVQRAPLAGRLIDCRTIDGPHGNAMLASSETNHRQLLYFQTDWGPCVVGQIAGLIARRIVRWVEPGDQLTAGQRLGMIKFGSRVTLRLPASCHLVVEPGQEVRAGRTIVARR